VNGEVINISGGMVR